MKLLRGDDWKNWTWGQFEKAIERTAAVAKDAPALLATVKEHCDRVNSVFARQNVVYDRIKSEIEGKELDPKRQKEQLDRLFGSYYQAKRDVTRRADHELVEMLRRAARR